MRTREYISPSAIALWNKDPEAFYIKYLADVRLPSEPQTRPMSIGSSFDAYCKSYLYEKLNGKGNPQFAFETIFEQQVESPNRDWARVHGKRCFEHYTQSGALNDLYVELSQASSSPRFEFEIRGGVVCKTMDTNGMVLLGKPDCYYINKLGHPVILDWKVNGWCSNSGVSPHPGYVRLRHCDGTVPKNVSHPKTVLGVKHGVTVSTNYRLEAISEEWAGQLAIYGWLCGEEAGNEFLTCIDQIVCKPTGGFPELRVAEHRTWVSSTFQLDYLSNAKTIWDTIHSDWIFRDLTREESAQRCKTLDTFVTADYHSTSGDDEDAFKALTRVRVY